MEVDLRNRRITRLDFTHDPASLTDQEREAMDGIDLFRASDNAITSITNLMMFRNLMSLDVSRNKLTLRSSTAPYDAEVGMQWVAHLPPSLVTLNVSRNPLKVLWSTQSHGAVMYTFLRHLPNLKLLDLAYTELEGVAMDARSVDDSVVARNRTLTVMSLSGNVDLVHGLQGMCLGLFHLEELHLEGCTGLIDDMLFRVQTLSRLSEIPDDASLNEPNEMLDTLSSDCPRLSSLYFRAEEVLATRRENDWLALYVVRHIPQMERVDGMFVAEAQERLNPQVDSPARPPTETVPSHPTVHTQQRAAASPVVVEDDNSDEESVRSPDELSTVSTASGSTRDNVSSIRRSGKVHASTTMDTAVGVEEFNFSPTDAPIDSSSIPDEYREEYVSLIKRQQVLVQAIRQHQNHAEKLREKSGDVKAKLAECRSTVARMNREISDKTKCVAELHIEAKDLQRKTRKTMRDLRYVEGQAYRRDTSQRSIGRSPSPSSQSSILEGGSTASQRLQRGRRLAEKATPHSTTTSHTQRLMLSQQKVAIAHALSPVASVGTRFRHSTPSRKGGDSRVSPPRSGAPRHVDPSASRQAPIVSSTHPLAEHSSFSEPVGRLDFSSDNPVSTSMPRLR